MRGGNGNRRQHIAPERVNDFDTAGFGIYARLRALIELRGAVRVRQRLVLAGAIRGSARRRAGGRLALRNGAQWRQPL